MNGIHAIIEDIVQELALSPYLAGRKVVSGFSATPGDTPLRQATVAVSLSGLEMTEGAFGQYFGTSATGEVCGRSAVLRVELRAAVPKKQGGAACHRLLSDLSSAVLTGDFGGSVLNLSAGQVSFERAFGGLVLPITLTLSCIIGETVPDVGESYRDVIVKLK